MAINGGFFNAVDEDRKYDAEDVNEFFDGVVAEGVFSTVESALAVTGGPNMDVAVAPGKAWFLKSWLTNTASYSLTIATADNTYPRIDIIALDFNKAINTRENKIVIVKGAATSITPIPPDLIDASYRIQIPLAHVLVGVDVTIITSSDITTKIGTAECPFVTGLIDQVDITTLLAQWDQEYDDWVVANTIYHSNWVVQTEDEHALWIVERDAAYALWVAQNEADLIIWMAGIEADLAAIETGEIFAELDEIRARGGGERNLIINGTMIVNQRTNKETVTGYAGDEAYPGVVDRWSFDNYGAPAIWSLSRTDHSPGVKALRIQCTTAKPTPDVTDYLKLEQPIEANRFCKLNKGTVDAQEMVLSWEFKSNLAGTYIAKIMDYQNVLDVSKAVTYNTPGLWKSFEFLVPKELTLPLNMDSDTGVGLAVQFAIMAGSYWTNGTLPTTWGTSGQGSAMAGQVNLAASVGNYMEITKVQLEVGPYKSHFERLPYEEILRKCQRYMEYTEKYYFMASPKAFDTDSLLLLGRSYGARKRIPPFFTYTSGEVIDYAYTLTGLQEYYLGAGSIPCKELSPSLQFILSQALSSGSSYNCVLHDFFVNAEVY